ncbi:MAG: DNA adenine methylase [Candidatus Margulisbacteria bacterium]|jgi:adenine-specific DNA methylase|nr:DNA adenine methylase [Candidatus Margulisiibacteriota bacterium]
MNYIGSKLSLLPFLTASIAKVADKKCRVFCDLFAGTAALPELQDIAVKRRKNFVCAYLTGLLNSIDKYANTASVYGAFLKKLKKSARRALELQPAELIMPRKNLCIAPDGR